MPELNIEEEYQKVQANLKEVGDNLRTYAEQSQKEIKRTSQMSAETQAKVDELLLLQGELTARLKAAEQMLVEGQSGGREGNAPQSLGSLVTSSSEFDVSGLVNSKSSRSIGVNMAITSDDSSGGTLIETQRQGGVIVAPQQRLFLRDILRWTPTTSNSIEFVRETGFTNNADVVSENPTAGKPESTITYEMDSASVATIAHWVHASRQVLHDARQLRSQIDGRLMYGLKLKEEGQLLNGSGAGLNILGINTQATAFSDPGVNVESDTFIDRLRIALLQVTLAEYEADAIVLNPIDWCSIELTKDRNNNYLFATPHGMAVPGLWGRPVVATKSMAVNNFLTGSFSQGAEGHDSEKMTVTASTEDRDNFIKNMVTILCEERIALTVYRPESFVSGDFDGLVSSN